MKKIIASITVAAIAVAVSALTLAAAEKEIKGEGLCAKCSLKETDACQNAIKVKEGDKTVTYYLQKNEISDKFHSNLCSKTAKVIAKGEVKEEKGKMILVVSKIELDPAK